jgi:hypothetical protein
VSTNGQQVVDFDMFSWNMRFHQNGVGQKREDTSTENAIECTSGKLQGRAWRDAPGLCSHRLSDMSEIVMSEM